MLYNGKVASPILVNPLHRGVFACVLLTGYEHILRLMLKQTLSIKLFQIFQMLNT